jgi:lipoprotein-anchoring transpeptidase ErfK/SrfK
MLKKTLAGLICASLISGSPIYSYAAEGNGAAETAISSETNAQSVIPAKAAQKIEKADRIVINLAARSLAVYQDGRKIRLYPVGVGRVSTPTPTGYYSILEKIENPTWTDPGDSANTVAAGEDNPLGMRWMQFQGNYGIHGTNKPASVGGYVSNGCVRLKEGDIEGLYKITAVGTPVEITYNRVVVEKMADNTVVYYIYPDGYNRQPLDAADVEKWLSGYGVSDFASDDDIASKIEASDGEPTYIAKVYPLYVNGKKLTEKAIIKDGISYLPAAAIAKSLNLALNWEPAGNMLVSTYGKAIGCMEKQTMYVNADDAGVLYHLSGGLDQKDTYVLQSGTAGQGKDAAGTDVVVLNKPVADAAAATKPAAATEPAPAAKPALAAKTAKPAAGAKAVGTVKK